MMRGGGGGLLLSVYFSPHVIFAMCLSFRVTQSKIFLLNNDLVSLCKDSSIMVLVAKFPSKLNGVFQEVALDIIVITSWHRTSFLQLQAVMKIMMALEAKISFTPENNSIFLSFKI